MCNFSQSGLQRYDYFLTYASVLIYLGKDILNERERPVSDISPYHSPTTPFFCTTILLVFSIPPDIQRRLVIVALYT